MARSLWVLIAAADKPALLKRTLNRSRRPPSQHRIAARSSSKTGHGVERNYVRGLGRQYNSGILYVPEANKSHALNRGLSVLDEGLGVHDR